MPKYVVLFSLNSEIAVEADSSGEAYDITEYKILTTDAVLEALNVVATAIGCDGFFVDVYQADKEE